MAFYEYVGLVCFAVMPLVLFYLIVCEILLFEDDAKTNDVSEVENGNDSV